MSDLISRSKIYNYIKAQINPYGKPFEGDIYEFGIKLMEYIDNMTTKQQWIPCSERLPEHQNEVLITLWIDCINIGWFDLNDKQWCINEFECEDGEVIAWMEKPEPYKGE